MSAPSPSPSPSPAPTSPLPDTLPQGPIEPGYDVEDEEEFAESDYESTAESESTSITSSVYAHTYENGRRFHTFRHGRYPIPNDDVEQNREDMKHAMMLELTDGKLFLAPIKENPQKIIDLGTGTGIWAIDVGDKYPSATVLGVDLSPIQPLWVPPNVKFMVDDIEDEWVHSTFDFIHMRTISPIIKDVPKLLKQALAHLEPGGFFEAQEIHAYPYCDDGTMPDDYPIAKLYTLLNKAFKGFGTEFDNGERMASMMEDAGFVNVHEKILKVPIGTWPKNKTLRLVGMYWRLAISDFLPPVGGRILLSLGMSPEEIEVFLVGVRKALADTSVHSYFNYHMCYGQKAE